MGKGRCGYEYLIVASFCRRTRLTCNVLLSAWIDCPGVVYPYRVEEGGGSFPVFRRFVARRVSGPGGDRGGMDIVVLVLPLCGVSMNRRWFCTRLVSYSGNPRHTTIYLVCLVGGPKGSVGVDEATLCFCAVPLVLWRRQAGIAAKRLTP